MDRTKTLFCEFKWNSSVFSGLLELKWEEQKKRNKQKQNIRSINEKEKRSIFNSQLQEMGEFWGVDYSIQTKDFDIRLQ